MIILKVFNYLKLWLIKYVFQYINYVFTNQFILKNTDHA